MCCVSEKCRYRFHQHYHHYHHHHNHHHLANMDMGFLLTYSGFTNPEEYREAQ